MTLSRHDRRKRVLIGLSAIAASLLVLNVFTNGANAAFGVSDRFGHNVFPGIETALDDAKTIQIKVADLSYTLKRTEEGSNEWMLIESGSYPVRPDRLQHLAEGLTNLQWGYARTTDPDKLHLIGLGDPADGGNGAAVQIFDKDNNLLADFITGRREDRLYGRLTSEQDAFLLQGSLPPLYTREAWLDLNIVTMLDSVISAVRLEDEAGDALYMARPPGANSRAFRPAPPFESDQLISRLAPATTALAISRFAPIDVKPSAALQSRPVARHITSTYDGLEVDVSAYRESDGFYVTLRAVEAGEGARRAETINGKAEGWAFRLTEFDWNEFTPPVRSLVVRASPGENTRP